MAQSLTPVRIFVASPGDVSGERDALSKVVSEINLTLSALAPDRGIVLELVRWETNVHPAIGPGPQNVVNEQIGDYDIFVGIMWKRFGTKTDAAGSGTEEEFQRAFSRWKQSKQLPIMFYFCQAASMAKTADEALQLAQVLRFREELSKIGLISDYPGAEDFADVVRPHLIRVLSRMFSGKATAAESARQTSERLPDSDIAAARAQAKALGAEYERLRRDLPSGEKRTRQMSAIQSKLQSIALSLYPIIRELMDSDSPGERLAAIATLKEIPTPEHLAWLADRVSEKPFIGYHATVALLTAARTIGREDPTLVRSALRRAAQTMKNMAYQDPNQTRTLDAALNELG